MCVFDLAGCVVNYSSRRVKSVLKSRCSFYRLISIVPTKNTHIIDCLLIHIIYIRTLLIIVVGCIDNLHDDMTRHIVCMCRVSMLILEQPREL